MIREIKKQVCIGCGNCALFCPGDVIVMHESGCPVILVDKSFAGKSGHSYFAGGAMMRKETRPNIFYREEFPDRDNQNWLKWIIAKRSEDGGIGFSTRNIPFEDYPLRP